MIILDVNKLEKDFGYGKLFEDTSFSLNEGESISIVGPNGCGKSTLLKIIAGLEKMDGGQVSIKKGAKVAYLDQVGSSIDDERTVFEILKDAFKNLNEMERQISQLEEKLNSSEGEEYDRILERYCSLIEKFSDEGGYNRESQINTVVEGLKINRQILSQRYNDLSGGEKTLVQLAKILIMKPDLLLLDEPTNHLDIDRIEWLEDYIKSFKGASVIISHDRYFLDRMSNKILDLESTVGKVYSTNYTGFIKEKEQEFEKQMAEYKDQQALIKRLEAEKKYFAERGMATNSSTLTGRAHVLQNRIDMLKQNAVARPQKQRRLNVGFDEESKSSKRVISIKGLTVLAPEGRKILDNIDFDIRSGERVALIGSNGSGKTTLVKTILGQQELRISGETMVGQSVQIGYLPQIIQFPNENQKLLEYFKNATRLDEEHARRILASFRFYQEDVNKRVKNLSGGEKMRIKLAELLQQKINTLIFDEPTNHIDIATKEVLENAIEDFDGTLIFVSHDRYFINKFADRVVEFKDGKVTTYLGNYDDYKEKKSKLKEASTINSENINEDDSRKKKNKKTRDDNDEWER